LITPRLIGSLETLNKAKKDIERAKKAFQFIKRDFEQDYGKGKASAFFKVMLESDSILNAAYKVFEEQLQDV